MAKLNPITSATNSDPETTLPDVASSAEGFSRRKAMTLMSTVAAAPALAFVGAPPALAKQADRSEWDMAFAAYKRAEHDCDAICQQCNKIAARYFEETQALPHGSAGPDPYSGEVNPVTTADTWRVNSARRFIEQLDTGKARIDPIPSLEEHVRHCRRLVAVADEREAKIAEIDKRLGYRESEARADAAVDRMCEARDRLIAMPAPDAEALMWKLDYLFFQDSVWEDGFVEQTVADARRFLTSIH